jgi:vitamin B12 transporter
VTPVVRLGIAALALTGESQFDGYDPVTFVHTDTRDNSRNELGAASIWADVGSPTSPWAARISASLLGSADRNYLASEPVNRTTGTRRTIEAQVERRFSTGQVQHELIVAADTEHETFHARDTAYGGATDQDRNRDHDALTAEWRASLTGVTTDLAIRRDMFNRFADASSIRASALARLGGGFALAGSYAQGIAQPTFFDLYGFFPGNFVGNPSLKPESSRGFETSLRYRRAAFEASLTAYKQRLYDEIVDVTDPASFLQTTVNRHGTSYRSGVEAEAAWHLGEKLRIAVNYAFLHATQPDQLGQNQETELRRPKHSGSVEADGASGKWLYGGSIAYVGTHLDTADNYPFGLVRLHSYWLASARVGYQVRQGLEAYVRGSNLFNAHYEDSAGYRTEGFGLFAGVRITAP